MGSPAMGASTEDLRTLVEGHEPASPREVAARERFLTELARLSAPCDEHADPTHVTASGIVVGPARHGAAPAQAPRHLDAARRPHRRRRDPRRAARREATEELGLAVAHPAAGPRLIHLDVHEAALGHTHLDLRYLLLGADDDPHPPPGESPDARWCSWDEALAMADAALVDALPVARAAYEALLVTDALDHLLAVQDLDTSITQLQHRRDALPETSGLAAVEAQLAALEAAAGGRDGAARPRWRRPRRTSRSRSPASPSAATAIEQRMYAATSSSARDLQAMNDEVRHLTERRAELEELELVAMLDQDPIDAELAALASASAPARGAGRGARGPRWPRSSSRSTPSWPPPSGPGPPRPPCSRPRWPTATRRCGRASRGPARPG